MEELEKIVEKLESTELKEMFHASIELARQYGVEEDKILKTKKAIDEFFLGDE